MAQLNQLNNCWKRFKITTLYVRPLAGKDHAEKLRHDDILNHFSAFGDITSVRLRNKPKQSYGFVKFTHPEAAAITLQTKIHIIAGQRVTISAAYDRHQDCVNLLDLNNDCLLEIFSADYLSVEDLCSVAETSRRLKIIAVEVFRRQYKECDFDQLISNSKGNVNEAKRILVNFGSVISALTIDGHKFKDNDRSNLLDSVTRCCSDSLDSLTLHNLVIPESFTAKLQPIFKKLQKCQMYYCTFEAASKELFADCSPMVELVIICNKDLSFIIEKTFPKHFEYKPYDLSDKVHINFESFFTIHQNLQMINISQCTKRSSVLQSIVDNCRQLEQLNCNVPIGTTFNLSNLGRLRKLKIDFATESVTKSSLGWNNLNFLVEIILENAKIDMEFVKFLSQLKRIEVFTLRGCTEIQNLQQMDGMNQLTELQIYGCRYANDFRLVHLIQRFDNLKYLTVDDFKLAYMDPETYLQIVRRRSDKSKLYFRLYSDCQYSLDDLYEDVFRQYRHLVEMQLGCFCTGGLTKTGIF